jgi:hypothetical protein
MATLTQKVDDLAVAIGTKVKDLSTAGSQVLTTIGGIQTAIDNIQAGALTPAQVNQLISDAQAAFIGAAPDALNSWIELVTAIQANGTADANALASLTQLISTKVPTATFDAHVQDTIGNVAGANFAQSFNTAAT